MRRSKTKKRRTSGKFRVYEVGNDRYCLEGLTIDQLARIQEALPELEKEIPDWLNWILLLRRK